MSEFSTYSLVRRVQGLILETFEISEQEAEVQAAGMVALAEGWGTVETAQELDWTYLIRKRLGEAKNFKWRSEADRQRFEADQILKYESYESLIRNRHSSKGK
jgi:hypothetical protein